MPLLPLQSARLTSLLARRAAFAAPPPLLRAAPRPLLLARAPPLLRSAMSDAAPAAAPKLLLDEVTGDMVSKK
jgi:hypothetical protein